jgi:hypothetical protein
MSTELLLSTINLYEYKLQHKIHSDEDDLERGSLSSLSKEKELEYESTILSSYLKIHTLDPQFPIPQYVQDIINTAKQYFPTSSCNSTRIVEFYKDCKSLETESERFKDIVIKKLHSTVEFYKDQLDKNLILRSENGLSYLTPDQVRKQFESKIFSCYLQIHFIDKTYPLPERVQEILDFAEDVLIHESDLEYNDLIEFHKIYQILQKNGFLEKIQKQVLALKSSGFAHKFLKLQKDSSLVSKITLTQGGKLTEELLSTHNTLTSFGLLSKVETQSNFAPLFKVQGDGNCYISIIVVEKDHSTTSVHSWLRLQDGAGNIYSFGKVVKETISLLDYAKNFKGLIVIGDHCEWSTSLEKDIVSKIQVTEEQFEIITQSIKEDLQKDLVYNLTQDNCVKWVYDKVALIRDDVDEDMVRSSLPGLFMPEKIVSLSPRFIRNLFSRFLPQVYHPRSLREAFEKTEKPLLFDELGVV